MHCDQAISGYLEVASSGTLRIICCPQLLSRCHLLVEFALAARKIALNGWNPTFLMPFIGGIYLLLICGLDRCRWPLVA